MDLYSVWLVLFSIISTLNVSNTSVNTCREPTLKVTYQSSSLNPSTVSDKAVDGCNNQRYSSSCCMHTELNGALEAWWLVDFNDLIFIESIKIYYRDEGVSQQKSRFGGFQILISNSSSTFSSTFPCYRDVTSSLNAMDLAPLITTCTGITRYLLIYLERRTLAYNWYSSSAIMELCEVLVYGCPVGKYGVDNCDLNCDATCINSLCDPTTGRCKYCADGYYKSSLICSPCPTNCVNNTCNVETGECTACITGFHGSLCDQSCPFGCENNICIQGNGKCENCSDGFYGDYCYACSSGCSALVCNKTTGYCSPCFSGFYGVSCNQLCLFNCVNGVCGQTTGECEACVTGYHGSTCHQICPTNCKNSLCSQLDGSCTACIPGYYGSTCGQFCPTNCKGNICNQLDGLCTACISGYYGSTCDQFCPTNCKDNICNQLDGLCTECASGFYGTGCGNICPTNCNESLCNRSSGECQNCKAGSHGLLCEYECPTQCKGGICTKVNGSCTDCQAGIYGVYCNIQCPAHCSSDGCGQETGFCTACISGYYGHSCQETCGQCRGDVCNIADGTCECSDGWEGLTCNTRTAVVDNPNNYTWIYAGGGIGAVVLITLVLVVIVIVLRRKRVSFYTKNPPEILDNTNGNVEMTPAITEKPATCNTQTMGPKHNAATIDDELTYMNTNDTVIKTKDDVAYHNVAGMSMVEFKSIVDSKMANNAAAFQEEFKTFPTGAVYPHEASKKPANKAKNRFRNTLPYDHSRIILDPTDGDIDSDYINANYIDGVDTASVYIASQGPKPKTTDDFWRMVWQIGSGKIVMLTNIMEGRKTKCHKYWPDEGHALSTKTFDLRLDRERIYAFYVLRDISIINKKNNQERQVHQFHFTTWPDHGTPDNLDLVQFHRRVMTYRTQLSGQIVVHCSAGIGRTGTFIGLDALLTYWKKTGKIDIPSYLTIMRNNRMDMIQTYKQYIALHELLVEGYNLQDTCISRTKFLATLKTLCPKKDASAKNTELLAEFEALQKCNPIFTSSNFTAALRKENREKNRDPNILAADIFRPFLQSQLSNRTDYINAVLIQSYTSKFGYLVTQFPLEDTREDFWAMVFDYSCRNIVVLGQLMEEYWLQENPGKRKAFSVKKIKELPTNSEVTITDYKVVNLRSSNATTVRIYFMSEWASDSLLPNSDSSLIQLLEQLDGRRRSDDTTPVVVMCRNGCTQSGLFCCISNIRDQLKMDQEVDIFQTARQLKRRRPEALGNVKQYQYCYSILGKYIESTDVYMN